MGVKSLSFIHYSSALIAVVNSSSGIESNFFSVIMGLRDWWVRTLRYGSLSLKWICQYLQLNRGYDMI